MRLSRENNLDGLQGIGQQELQAVQIMKDQVGAFIAGKPARETDREDFRIEQRAERDYTLGTHALFLPFFAGTLVNFVNQ